jgi:F-type H+-transporting ATPase subunit b
MTSDCPARQFLHCGILACAFVLIVLAPGAALGASTSQPPHEAAPVASHETTAEAPHGQTVLQTIAKVANFAILAAVLVYFLKSPIATYLSSRGTQIRQDLVTASDVRAAATARLAEIQRQLQALPAELEALKTQGARDVAAEQTRIAQAAVAERERLIAQTHREIETRLRMARRELSEHAARLAVAIAEERIRRSITPDDQLRLLDRYAAQLTEAR